LYEAIIEMTRLLLWLNQSLSLPKITLKPSPSKTENGKSCYDYNQRKAIIFLIFAVELAEFASITEM